MSGEKEVIALIISVSAIGVGVIGATYFLIKNGRAIRNRTEKRNNQTEKKEES